MAELELRLLDLRVVEGLLGNCALGQVHVLVRRREQRKATLCTTDCSAAVEMRLDAMPKNDLEYDSDDNG